MANFLNTLKQILVPGTLCCGWHLLFIGFGILIGRGYRVRVERP
jgi:hypothetical protein